MKICAIKDEVRNCLIGYLYYYEKSSLFLIELAPGLPLETVPVFFDSFVREGRLTIGPDWSRRYVEARVVPRDRQNLKSILRDAGLREYDAFKLLMLSNGRCSQDDCCIVPSAELPDWLLERRKRWLTQVTALKDFRLYLGFHDGISRIADMREKLGNERTLRILLQRPEDFQNVQILGSGRVLSWGGSRFILAPDLYQEGTLLPCSEDDLERILRDQLVDAAELSAAFQVSRQYISRVLQERGILPFKKSGACNLYLKKQVMDLFDK